MSHLSEKLAEFVFAELPMQEMLEARRHLAACSDCREQVEQFQSLHAMLRTSPDVEPPRRIMFEFEKSRAVSWIWRWLAPMAASAAVALAVVTFAPRPQPQIIERVVQQPVSTQPTPATAAPAAQQVDYQQLVSAVRAELKVRDAAQAKEIQRVRGQMALLEWNQRGNQRENIENGASIQMLAANRVRN